MSGFILFALGIAALVDGHPVQAASAAGAANASSAARPSGAMIPLRAIEQRIVPKMRGFSYLGPEYYSEAKRYRLKFLRGSKVVWIDVDSVTGEIVGKSF